MSQNEDLGIYKFLVIITVAGLLLVFFAYLDYIISGFSKILAFILVPIFTYAIYRIVKGIWPDFW